jgi:hypothetical protein
MIVAFLASDNKILNTAIFDDSFDGDLTEFYSGAEGITSHVIVDDGKVAVIGEIGLTTIAKPYSSWLWDKNTNSYLPPVSKPEGNVVWNEATTSWVEPDPLDIPPES